MSETSRRAFINNAAYQLQQLDQQPTEEIERSEQIESIYEAPRGVEIPEFTGQIQPINKNDSFGNISSEFNEFMMDNEGKIVFLDIWPYYTDEQLYDPENEVLDSPKLFTIREEANNSSAGGSEYSINASYDSDFFWDGRPSSRRIKGYFKILGSAGPYQGFMSVSIKPIDIEIAELLKK